MAVRRWLAKLKTKYISRKRFRFSAGGNFFFFFFVKEQNIILQSLKKVVLHFIHFIQCSRFFLLLFFPVGKGKR